MRCWPKMVAMFTAKGMATGGFPRGGFFTRPMSPTRQPRSSRLRSNISSYRTAPAIRSETRLSWAMTRTTCFSNTRSIRSAIGRAAEHDYRLLQPFRMTDPNGNRAEVAFDTLGHGGRNRRDGARSSRTSAICWKNSSPIRRSQQRARLCRGSAAATRPPCWAKRRTRIVYDLDRYHRSGQPSFAATLARETPFFRPRRRTDQNPGRASPTPTASAARFRRRSRPKRGEAPQRGPNVILPSGDVQAWSASA